MKLIELIQGSPEWHSHRAEKGRRNASEAAMALGVHPNVSRNAFMAAVVTGISKEFSDYVRDYILAEGHRAEKLALPLAEAIIGDSLYPVTGLEGDDSASFDGLTMDETIWYEHKSLNNELREILSRPDVTGADLPLYHQIQMESQAKVCGGTKGLFMASQWDDADNLIEELHCWYYPNPELRERIEAGWNQFFKDAENYQHREHAERPAAQVTIELPALYIQAQGDIIASNMAAYGQALAAKLAEVRAIKLVTDQDFSNAKEAAKLFRDQREKLKLAKEAMLAQTMTIGEAARMIDAWSEDLRVTALILEKDVEREDLAKKRAMMAEASGKWHDYIELLNDDLEADAPVCGDYGIGLECPTPDFAGALKSKRSYASMQDALDTALANGKIAADSEFRDLRGKLVWLYTNAVDYGFLLNDLQHIIIKPYSDFILLVQTRIGNHKAEQVRREAAIRAKAEADAAAKAKAKQDAVLAAERLRIQAEERARLEAEKARIQAEEQAKADALQSKAEVQPLPEPKQSTVDPEKVVVEHQDEIAEFMNQYDFGKSKDKIRAILVEFVKFQAERGQAAKK